MTAIALPSARDWRTVIGRVWSRACSKVKIVVCTQKVPLSFYSRKLMASYVEGMRKPSEPELHSGPLQIGHETWEGSLVWMFELKRERQPHWGPVHDTTKIYRNKLMSESNFYKTDLHGAQPILKLILFVIYLHLWPKDCLFDHYHFINSEIVQLRTLRNWPFRIFPSWRDSLVNKSGSNNVLEGHIQEGNDKSSDQRIKCSIYRRQNGK